MRVTLKDLALRARVSINTVSRALRNCDDISRPRREQIQNLARELGYEPDPALSALAAYRQRVRVKTDFSKLAVVSYWKDPDNWRKTNSGREFWSGAEVRARQQGYELEFFWLGQVGMNARRASQVLNYRGVRGLVLPPLPPNATRLRLDLDWNQFSVVTLERSDSLPNFLYVAPNYYDAMSLIWQQLVARGYRRPGLLLNEDNAGRSHHQWEAAMLIEQHRHHGRLNQDAILVHPAGSTFEKFSGLVQPWLVSTGVDVVIARAPQLGRLLGENRIRVPRDLGVVSLNVDDDNFGPLDPCGVDQQRRAMGAAAVDLVNSLLLRNHRGPEPHVHGMIVDGVWREGETLRASP